MEQDTEITPEAVDAETKPTVDKQVEPDYKKLEQQHKSLKGMYDAQAKEIAELKAKGNLVDEVRTLSAKQDDFSDLLAELTEKREEEEVELEEPKPKGRMREKIQQRQSAKGIITEYGLSSGDPRFADALLAPDPVRAVTHKLAEIHKDEDTKRQKELADQLEEEKQKLHEDYLSKIAEDLKGSAGGPSGKSVPLTSAERATAQKLGLSDEEYARGKVVKVT